MSENNMLTVSTNNIDLLDEFLRCMICFENYTNPRVLHCQHTFCELCLNRWSLKGGLNDAGLICPTCKLLTCLGDTGIVDLSCDFKQTRLSELLQQVLVKNDTFKRCCDICSASSYETAALYFCAQCSESLCTSCHSRHSSNVLFTSHHVVNLAVDDPGGKLFCTQHNTKPIRYMCEECTVFICTVCAINIHNDHEVHDLESGLRKYKIQLEDLSFKVNEKLADVQSVHEQLKDLQIVLKGYFENMEEQIDSCTTKQIEKTMSGQYVLQELISSKDFGESFRPVLWAINSMQDVGKQAISQQANVVAGQMKDEHNALIDNLKLAHKNISNNIDEKIDDVGFLSTCIEALVGFLDRLSSATCALEVITIFEELVSRSETILQCDLEIFTPVIKIIRFEGNECDYKMGTLHEESYSVEEFLQKQGKESTESESEESDCPSDLQNSKNSIDCVQQESHDNMNAYYEEHYSKNKSLYSAVIDVDLIPHDHEMQLQNSINHKFRSGSSLTGDEDLISEPEITLVNCSNNFDECNIHNFEEVPEHEYISDDSEINEVLTELDAICEENSVENESNILDKVTSINHTENENQDLPSYVNIEELQNVSISNSTLEENKPAYLATNMYQNLGQVFNQKTAADTPADQLNVTPEVSLESDLVNDLSCSFSELRNLEQTAKATENVYVTSPCSSSVKNINSCDEDSHSESSSCNISVPTTDEASLNLITDSDSNTSSPRSSYPVSLRSAPDLCRIRKDLDEKKYKRMSLPVASEEIESCKKRNSHIGFTGFDISATTPDVEKNLPWANVKGHSRSVSSDGPINVSKHGFNDDRLSLHTSPRMVNRHATIPEIANKIDFFNAQPVLLWEKMGTGKMHSIKRHGKKHKNKNIQMQGLALNPELNCPCDISFLTQGDIIIADNSERNLQVLSADTVMWSKVKDRMQPLVTSKALVSGLIDPVCITLAPKLPESLGLNHKDIVVMTDSKDKCIKMIDIKSKGSLAAMWGKSWFLPMFKSPSGIAVTQDDKWVISDIGKHIVTLHSPDGQIVNQFGSRGKGAYGFECPKYLATDLKNRILVSDSGNGGVKVYDNNAQFLYKISSQKESHLTGPMGICVDHQNNVIVADRYRHSVNLFAPDGRFVRNLLGPEHDIKSPCGVAVTDYGQLAITQFDPPAVKLFQFSN